MTMFLVTCRFYDHFGNVRKISVKNYSFNMTRLQMMWRRFLSRSYCYLFDSWFFAKRSC